MTDLPKLELHRVFKLRDKLITRVLHPRVGQLLQTTAFETVVRDLRRNIGTSVPNDALYESVRNLLGVELTPYLIHTTAWRLAANVQRLANGFSVPPWTCQHNNEWVPVQVLRCQRERNQYDSTGFRYRLQYLAGEPAGLLTEVFWSYKVAKVVALLSGFSWRTRSGYTFEHPLQLVGMRFFAYVEPVRSTNGPTFREFQCSSALINWNRKKVLQTRLRVKGAKCPRNFTHACHRCAVGYDHCDFATHPKTYYAAACTECQQDHQPFDPDDPSSICVSCTNKRRMSSASSSPY